MELVYSITPLYRLLPNHNPLHRPSSTTFTAQLQPPRKFDPANDRQPSTSSGLIQTHVLAHEIGAGSPCRKCECTGLDLHFWRKICKSCGCRMDEHDVIMPNQYDHGQVVVGRLFGAKEHFETSTASPLTGVTLKSISISERKSKLGFNSPNLSTAELVPKLDVQRAIPAAVYNYRIDSGRGGNHKETTEYAWAPVPDQILVDKYMYALPEEERPIVGTVGEQNRKGRLQFQLPLYDCNVEDARFASEKDKEVLQKFVDNVKKNVIGVGTLVEVDASKEPAKENSTDGETLEQSLERALHSLDHHNHNPNDCKTCSNQLQDGDVGIHTDHGRKNELWHPNCFRCSVCDQLLVDLIYFYHDGKYFCGRHFADTQYPRCSGCDELIFANEYTFAEEKSWHFDHFACFKCDLKLGGHRYMMKDSQPHCIPCYMEHFAKTCTACNDKIGPDEKRLNYKEFHWHAKEDCFHCTQCEKALIGQKFIMKETRLFCSSQCKGQYLEKA